MNPSRAGRARLQKQLTVLNILLVSDNSDSSSVKSSGRPKLKLESTEAASPPPISHRIPGRPENPKQPGIHQPYKDLISSSSTLTSSSGSHFTIPGLSGRYPPIYPGLPAPPPSAFYPPTSSAALLSSYFGSGLSSSPGSLVPTHPASHLAAVSPYMPGPQPAGASSIHSFLAAIEAASAVAQLQQQQQQQQQQHQLNNNNNHQGSEIKRPIPVSPASGQILMDGCFKKNDIQFPLL